MFRRVLIGVLAGAAVAARAGDPSQGGNVQADLRAEPPSISAGETFWTAVRLRMAPGWHTYWKDPGDSGMATKIRWELPAGFAAGEIHWPVPEKIEIPPLVDHGYHGEAVLLVPLTAPPVLSGKTVTIKARVDWLECAEVCIPGRADLSLVLPVAKAPVPPTAESAAFFEAARAQLPKPGEDPYAFLKAARTPTAAPVPLGLALLFAFLGGMILNLMPCVLPVLSIKVLGFLQENARTGRRHSWLYFAGVVASFWALGGVLLALRAAGEPLGWGFQLQSPFFVGLLILLFFALGLNLLGVFEIGTSFVGLAAVAGGKTNTAAFLSGALAVLVATPCTAPFMGPALGYAVTQPPAASLAVFTALALGMALPYVALAHFPAALRWVPKPGSWMITLKQFMAFLFFATVLWLLWVLGLQKGSTAVIATLAALWTLALGSWFYGPLQLKAKTPTHRWSFNLAAILLAGAAVFLIVPKKAPAEAIAWQPYSDARLEEARAAGQPVFVDFTAAWCLTCQVNERTTLSSKPVRRAFRDKGLVALKADWTNRDPDITRALARFDRNGVPLYVYYAPGKDPVLLPAVLTNGIVLDVLKDTPDRGGNP